MAWNLAGFSRNSLISCSSSIASSTPATSANVVFGVSLLTSLALALPKFITRLPPPWIWFITRNSRNTTMAMGSRDSSSWTNVFSWVTFVVYVAPSGALDWILLKISSADCAGYDAVIFLLPSTSFFKVMSRVCCLSLTVILLKLPWSTWSSALEVSTSAKPPLPRNSAGTTSTTSKPRASQTHHLRKKLLRSMWLQGDRSGWPRPPDLAGTGADLSPSGGSSAGLSNGTPDGGVDAGPPAGCPTLQ